MNIRGLEGGALAWGYKYVTETATSACTSLPPAMCGERDVVAQPLAMPARQTRRRSSGPDG
jgi:hypothetical protein